MKIEFLLGMVLVSASGALASNAGATASSGAVVTSGNARFTVLTPEMIRIEYSEKGIFEDRPTFAIVNRKLEVPSFSQNESEGWLSISTDRLVMRYLKDSDPSGKTDGKPNLTVTMPLGNDTVRWSPGQEDTQNLLGTTRTLDGAHGRSKMQEMEQGIISRSGWAVIDDSPAALRGDGSRSLAFELQPDSTYWVAPRADEGALDLYFMGYGHNYKKALYDFTRIAGKTPLPPVYVLGYWYSKYAPYSSDDYRRIMKELADHDINTDVMILDMDWHYNGDSVLSGGRGGWTGWTWNPALIPDPEKLLADIHDADMHVSLNLHPADGFAPDEDFYEQICRDTGFDSAKGERLPWMLENKRFADSFFRNFARTREKEGVDFWWIDWQQNPVNPRMDGLGETFWCNYAFFDDMRRNRPDRRPLIFHRWGGLGSHRYQIGFSGDATINYPTLAFEPYFTSTASNVGYSYWGHDLGGHYRPDGDPNDPEMLLRWMQFGVFTPIFRTHATNDSTIERRIWKYDNFSDLNSTVRLRYRLLPYIYTMARKSYDTGVGICRPLYYEYPELEQAYARENEYFFGDDIIVSPVVSASVNGVSSESIWLPDGSWWAPDLKRTFTGGEHRIDFTMTQIPYFIRRGAVIPMNGPEVKRASATAGRLLLGVYSGADGEGEYYEDGGDTNDYAEKFAVTHFTHKDNGKNAVLDIGARVGGFDGMPEKRGYRLEIHGEKPVKEARLDGKKLKVVNNAEEKVSIIDLDARSCTVPTRVELTYGK